MSQLSNSLESDKQIPVDSNSPSTQASAATLVNSRGPTINYFFMRGFQKYGGHFSENKSACGNVPTSLGLPKNMGAIFLKTKKRRLQQRTHKLRASKNMGATFLEKKGACGNVPTSSGLPKNGGAIFLKKKAPATTYPQAQGFQKLGGHFSGKKSARWALKAHDGL